MLVSDFAMMDPGPMGDSLFSKCSRAIAHFFGFGDHPSRRRERLEVEVQPPVRAVDPVAESGIHMIEPEAPAQDSPDFRWRRHQQLRNRPTSTLSGAERQARQHAVRGLYAAREGALDCAEHHFTRAAACLDVDLSEVPGFWNLGRSAMLTAVLAYEANDRLRDASALNARIRTHLRPRALSPLPDNVTELPTRRLSMSGNS